MASLAVAQNTTSKKHMKYNRGQIWSEEYKERIYGGPAPGNPKNNKEYGEGILSVEKIPTLDKLYNDNVLKSTESEYNASQPINERVGLGLYDITKLKIDAIVNAANKNLRGGGGIDGAIHEAAGTLLLEECKLYSGCDTGKAVITNGYNLPAQRVIHTVGPICDGGGADEASVKYLRDCYRNCMKLAEENSLQSIAFCCISTGIYKFPPKHAAEVACREIRRHLDSTENSIIRVVFIVFSEADYDHYREMLPKFFPPGAKDVESKGERMVN